MSINTSITSRSCEILSVAVRNVLSGLWIAEPFSQTEIDDINIVLLLANSDEEVIGLNVPV